MNRFNIITLGVKDINKSLRFYKALGFKTATHEDETPAIVFFNTEGTKLALYEQTDLLNDTTLDSFASEGFKGITLAFNAKAKDTVDQLLKKAKILGGKVIKEASNTDWGGYSGYFLDLDGHCIEIAYGAMWQFDEHNMLIIEE